MDKRILEKAKNLENVYLDKECPKCNKKIDMSFLGYKYLSPAVGIVWQCPHCYCDFYIAEMKLEERK